jgi:hypothetical protein
MERPVSILKFATVFKKHHSCVERELEEERGKENE